MKFTKINSFSGRVLWLDSSGTLYVARQFDIFRTENQGKTWQKLWTIPVSGWKPQCAKIRLAARLLRQEIRTFKEELLAFLKKHKFEYDETYLWN